jgi:hypothetical protein
MCLAYKDEGRKEEILRVEHFKHGTLRSYHKKQWKHFEFPEKRKKKSFPVCFFKTSKKNQILQSKFYLSVYEIILYS